MIIFIGYDAREDEAYRVCKHSLRNYRVVPMKHKELRNLGLFDRPWRVGETGQYVDERDQRPFSTEFSHSRFLVPHLAEKLGVKQQWALFCDCDFLFLNDVTELFALADPSKAVMCVQHQHEPEEGEKMDGVMQTRYFRKNWSSLVLWNLEHPANSRLTVDAVSNCPGSWLHKFGWLEDHEIGSLPMEWNYLVGHTKGVTPKAVHYTEGGPWFPEYKNVPYAQEWRAVRRDMLAQEFING